ncbi:hypothetical protein Tco_1166916 [Tanacetum coccineum]
MSSTVVGGELVMCIGGNVSLCVRGHGLVGWILTWCADILGGGRRDEFSGGDILLMGGGVVWWCGVVGGVVWVGLCSCIEVTRLVRWSCEVLSLSVLLTGLDDVWGRSLRGIGWEFGVSSSGAAGGGGGSGVCIVMYTGWGVLASWGVDSDCYLSSGYVLVMGLWQFGVQGGGMVEVVVRLWSLGSWFSGDLLVIQQVGYGGVSVRREDRWLAGTVGSDMFWSAGSECGGDWRGEEEEGGGCEVGDRLDMGLRLDGGAEVAWLWVGMTGLGASGWRRGGGRLGLYWVWCWVGGGVCWHFDIWVDVLGRGMSVSGFHWGEVWESMWGLWWGVVVGMDVSVGWEVEMVGTLSDMSYRYSLGGTCNIMIDMIIDM